MHCARIAYINISLTTGSVDFNQCFFGWPLLKMFKQLNSCRLVVFEQTTRGWTENTSRFSSKLQVGFHNYLSVMYYLWFFPLETGQKCPVVICLDCLKHLDWWKNLAAALWMAEQVFLDLDKKWFINGNTCDGLECSLHKSCLLSYFDKPFQMMEYLGQIHFLVW